MAFDFLDEFFGLSGVPAQRAFRRKAEKVHIGTGIDGAQGAIDLEAVGLRLDVEALREDGLKDIAGGDVLLGAGDGGEKIIFGRAVVHLELALAFVGRADWAVAG